MKSLRHVGLETGSLSDEELRYIEERIVESVRPQLVGRKLFPVFKLPHAGFLTVRGYKMTDMSQASISLYGQTTSKDRTQLASFDITVPVIHKEFTLWWRDVLAARGGGLPLETREAQNAARKIAEDEDRFLLTGESTGFQALGVEGLATATGRNTTAGGDWSANAFTYVNNAIGELETDGHLGPYALILRSAWWRQIAGAFVTNTATTIAEKVAELCKAGVYVSDSLYESDGTTHNALVVEPSQDNFELIIGQDLTTFTKEDEDMNIQAKCFEVLAPRINRPTSICEITGLT
jgi:uncharacterized linocin/CFP29 family protein